MEDITRGEELRAIKRLKVRKSPGIDDRTGEVLRVGRAVVAGMLRKDFNRVRTEERVSRDWAKMLVFPIHKEGSKLKPDNTELSQLSILRKVFWSILLERMKPKLELFMSWSLFGFRSGRKTVDAIFIMSR